MLAAIHLPVTYRRAVHSGWIKHGPGIVPSRLRRRLPAIRVSKRSRVPQLREVRVFHCTRSGCRVTDTIWTPRAKTWYPSVPLKCCLQNSCGRLTQRQSIGLTLCPGPKLQIHPNLQLIENRRFRADSRKTGPSCCSRQGSRLFHIPSTRASPSNVGTKPLTLGDHGRGLCHTIGSPIEWHSPRQAS